MTLVVDASVAVLWILTQRNSDKAATLQSEDGLIAPSLIVAEIGNAIWKAVRRGDLPAREGRTAIEIALGLIDSLVPVEELHTRALEFAIQLDHAIYDCFYLALAERERCALVTEDTRLLAAAKRVKAIDLRPL